MLAAKVEETCIISIWHYFCSSQLSSSTYLTAINNNYPISIVINKMLKQEGQGAEVRELKTELNLCCFFRSAPISLITDSKSLLKELIMV